MHTGKVRGVRSSRRVPLAAACAALLSVVAYPLQAQPPAATVMIYMNSQGCPVGESQPLVVIDRGKFIAWQAVSEGSRQPIDAEFEIFFDPIKGRTLRSNNGSVRARIDDRAPTVEYKYTIVSDDCTYQPRDPRLRVR